MRLLTTLVLAAWVVAAPAVAQGPDLREEVFERLVVLLAKIPEQWDDLPAAKVEPSGRRLEAVFADASEAETGEALGLISLLQRSPLAARDVLIAEIQAERTIREIDLWVPFALADNEQRTDLVEAALTTEAWLQWSLAIGRRDVLISAGGFGLYLAQLRANPPNASPDPRKMDGAPAGHWSRGWPGAPF